MSFVAKSAAEIRGLADKFLHEYGSEDVAPVDFDEIAEFDLRINVQVRAGLHADRGVEAGISHDLKTIYVELSVSDDEIRWSYAIAHELAHVVLHADYIQSLPCESDKSLTEAIVNIPDDVLDLLETEAQIFAEAVLVPEKSLRRLHQEEIESASSAGHSIERLSYEKKDNIAGRIARAFCVEPKTVVRRLSFLQLAGWEPEPDAPRLLDGFTHRND